MQCFGFCGDLAGCHPATPNRSGSNTLGLSAPVGGAPRCRNVPGDVRAVQHALNSFTATDGGPAPKLVEDGLYGSKTAAAIQKFQVKSFGWGGTDGVVDPGQQTDRKLARGGDDLLDLPNEMINNIPYVLTILSITRGQIAAARSFRDGLTTFTGSGESSWKKLVKHFQIDRFPDWQTRLADTDRVYADMQTAIGYVPQGLVLFANEPAGHTSGYFAFAYAGGYSVAKRSQSTYDGTPMGSIDVTPKMRLMKRDAFAYIMIHELAHFVGPDDRFGQAILDYAYHRNPVAYEWLVPWQRIHNADCYSQYAFDAMGEPFRHSDHIQ
ncbi:MAG: peptidoglycan-binding protein [Burkholderiales bacterium]|nr:peptidoglycan-binding protein [Burkholderiales bacterium]